MEKLIPDPPSYKAIPISSALHPLLFAQQQRAHVWTLHATHHSAGNERYIYLASQAGSVLLLLLPLASATNFPRLHRYMPVLVSPRYGYPALPTAAARSFVATSMTSQPPTFSGSRLGAECYSSVPLRVYQTPLIPRYACMHACAHGT